MLEIIPFPHGEAVSLQLLRAPFLRRVGTIFFEPGTFIRIGTVYCRHSPRIPSSSACKGTGPHLMLPSLSRRPSMEAVRWTRKQVWFSVSLAPSGRSPCGVNGQDTRARLKCLTGLPVHHKGDQHIRVSYQGLKMCVAHPLPDCTSIY